MNRQRGPDPAVGGVERSVPDLPSEPDDREALRTLFRATGAAAFGLALRVLHRRGAAEDVVREGYRRLRTTPWTADAEPPDPPADLVDDHGPDLGTPWGRSAFVGGQRRDPGSDTGFGRGAVYGRDGSRVGGDRPPVGEPELPAPYRGRGEPQFDAEQTWLLAQVHRLAIQRLRLDRHDRDDMPWLAASARLGFADPLDSHCEVFVLAYYGGRTYRAIGRELGLRVPVVTRLLAESVERLAEQRTIRVGSTRHWCPPGSVLALADAYALDAVAELEHHHIENKLATMTTPGLAQFADRVRGVHDVLARLAADDQRTPPRHLETRILADLSGPGTPRRGHWTARPPWLRRFGGPLGS
ncbi:RNA polymerase sigma factor [Nocardia sp. NPDC058379]|uniref:RNA polymerase sigma factor n=1 Tax=unclassified Nocardia TaxID=2637762 RepID=UPI003652BBAD